MRLMCNLINLVIVVIIWVGIALIPWVWIKASPLWFDIVWTLFSLILAGYFVQYVVSRWVNGIFFKKINGKDGADSIGSE